MKGFYALVIEEFRSSELYLFAFQIDQPLPATNGWREEKGEIRKLFPGVQVIKA